MPLPMSPSPELGLPQERERVEVPPIPVDPEIVTEQKQEMPKPTIVEPAESQIELPQDVISNPESEIVEGGGILEGDKNAVLAAKIIEDEFRKSPIQDPNKLAGDVAKLQQDSLKKWFGIELKL